MAAEKGARHVDVLWLVEHVDRELDVAVCCKIEIERRFGLTVEIANYYTDFERVTTGIVPNVVLVPFLFSAEDIGSKEYSRAWPGATLVNLRWEQILYQANNALKQLRGDVARDVVRHVAWSAESRDELVAQGARSPHVLLTGHPLWSLYERPYRGAFVARTDLAGQHGLDPSRRWLFFPENYRWAFVKDSTLRKLEARGTGIAAEQLSELRAYCLDSLRTVLGWLDAAARDDEWEVIFRPRPSTNTAAMHSLVASVLPDRAPRLRVIKEHSVREWVLASDHVMSSFSTSLIEAALAGKPINTVSPSPVPKLLRYDWCDLVQDLGSVDAITAALRDPAGKAIYAPTADWARARFQPRGNPIVVLAEEIGRLATRYLVEATPPVVLPLDHQPPSVPKGFFSTLTHDKDAWTPEALVQRQTQFEVVLEGCHTTSGEAGDAEGTPIGVPLTIVICTHNRAEYVEKLLDSLADQQSHHLDLEILVVDNRCTDRTMLVCRDRQDSMPALRYCFESALNLCHARNRGIAAAMRPHILYLDDDATVPQHYLRVAERILSTHDPDFFGGPVYPVYGTSKPDWFLDQFETRKYADEPQLIFDRSISGSNFGARRANLRQLGGFDPSLGMSGTTMQFMDERAVIELYRFLTPRRLQKVFYHPDLFISHHIDRKLTLSYQMRRAFKLMEYGVLVKRRFALASGLERNVSDYLMAQWGVLLSSGRTLVTASARAVFSWPPRLTMPAAKALIDIARALGAFLGCFRLWRAPELKAYPLGGALFVEPSKITALSGTAEEQNAILALADEIGVRAGIIGYERKTKQPLEALLRRERFRTFRRVVILGYLPGPRKRQLRSFCDGTEVVDFNDVSAPPLVAPASMDAKGQTACVQWLRDLSSTEAVPLAPRRHGILMIVGTNVTKTVLGRSDREKLLNWFQRSGVRVDCLKINGLRMAEILMHAGPRSYKTILALGVLSSESKRELQSLVKDVEGMEVEDLEDVPCSPDVYRAVSAASCLETASDAAPLLQVLRKLAGNAEGPNFDRGQA